MKPIITTTNEKRTREEDLSIVIYQTDLLGVECYDINVPTRVKEKLTGYVITNYKEFVSAVFWDEYTSNFYKVVMKKYF